MPRNLQLQEKLRKSQVLTHEDIYKDFILYAQEVRDQLQIYLYMQENQIGTNQTQYWLARFQVMQRLCMFKQIADLVPKVKKIPEIDMQFVVLCSNSIEKYESKLIKDFEFIICEPVPGRRKVNSLFCDRISNLHPEKRKIGNFEVYVDQDCRKNYKLPDYANYVQNQKKDYCQVQKQCYLRKQQNKPYSFLAKNQLQLILLAEQLLSKNGRNSLDLRKSMNVQRLSNNLIINGRQTFKEQVFNTPKCIQPNNRINYSTNKLNQAQSRDSFEILKQIKEKKVSEYRSPNFGQKEPQNTNKKEPNQLNVSNPITQYCRAANLFQNHKDDDLSFSFRKIRQTLSEQKKKEKKINHKQSCVDNAFIMYSFSKQSKNLQSIAYQFIKKQDFELELLINQIQQEKYQKLDSKTFSSEIDSNQQNNFYQSNYIFLNPERQPLNELFISSNYEKYDLEDLIRGNVDSIDLPENIITDLHCHSEQKQKQSPVYVFRSEQKRLSNITQEGSYYSDSRKKLLQKK